MEFLRELKLIELEIQKERGETKRLQNRNKSPHIFQNFFDVPKNVKISRRRRGQLLKRWQQI